MRGGSKAEQYAVIRKHERQPNSCRLACFHRCRASLPAAGVPMGDDTDTLDSKGGKKKRKKGRKSVAFGSPQAAEFNSSSPSASLTPMPTEAAKLKYAVPDNSMMSESSADTSTASASLMNITADSAGGNFEGGDQENDDDNTVELEGDINALMTSVSQGHGTNEMDEDENTVEVREPY